MTTMIAEQATKQIMTVADFEAQRQRGINTFRNVKIQSDLIIRGSGDTRAVGDLYIIDSIIEGRFDIHGLTFTGEFSLNGTVIRRDLNAQGSKFVRTVRLIDTLIKGRLNIVGTRFMSDILCGDNLELAMRFFFYNAGRVHVTRAAIRNFIDTFEPVSESVEV